jgi:hypothetical protein
MPMTSPNWFMPQVVVPVPSVIDTRAPAGSYASVTFGVVPSEYVTDSLAARRAMVWSFEVVADRADPEVGLPTWTGWMYPDWDRCGPRIWRWRGDRMLTVVGGAAARVAQQGVGGEDIGQVCGVGGFVLGVGMQGADQRPVGGGDFGWRGRAGDAECLVRVARRPRGRHGSALLVTGSVLAVAGGGGPSALRWGWVFRWLSAV